MHTEAPHCLGDAVDAADAAADVADADATDASGCEFWSDIPKIYVLMSRI